MFLGCVKQSAKQLEDCIQQEEIRQARIERARQQQEWFLQNQRIRQGERARINKENARRRRDLLQQRRYFDRMKRIDDEKAREREEYYLINNILNEVDLKEKEELIEMEDRMPERRPSKVLQSTLNCIENYRMPEEESSDDEDWKELRKRNQQERLDQQVIANANNTNILAIGYYDNDDDDEITYYNKR